MSGSAPAPRWLLFPTLLGVAGRHKKNAPEPAAPAAFNNPVGLAAGAQGAIYIADFLNHRIRKISTDGQVSTIAGTGEMGFADGPGLSAQFVLPYGLTPDAQGTLYLTRQVGS